MAGVEYDPEDPLDIEEEDLDTLIEQHASDTCAQLCAGSLTIRSYRDTFVCPLCVNGKPHWFTLQQLFSHVDNIAKSVRPAVENRGAHKGLVDYLADDFPHLAASRGSSSSTATYLSDELVVWPCIGIVASNLGSDEVVGQVRQWLSDNGLACMKVKPFYWRGSYSRLVAVYFNSDLSGLLCGLEFDKKWVTVCKSKQEYFDVGYVGNEPQMYGWLARLTDMNAGHALGACLRGKEVKSLKDIVFQLEGEPRRIIENYRREVADKDEMIRQAYG